MVIRRALALVALAALVLACCGFDRGGYGAHQWGGAGGAYHPRAKNMWDAVYPQEDQWAQPASAAFYEAAGKYRADFVLVGSTVEAVLTVRVRRHSDQVTLGIDRTTNLSHTPTTAGLGWSSTTIIPAGTVIDVLYKSDTSTPGYKDVTAWTVFINGWTAGSGEPPIDPELPAS